MKRIKVVSILIIITYFLLSISSSAQNNKEIDSLIAQIETMPDDTNKVKSLIRILKLSSRHPNYNTIYFARKTEKLAAKLGDTVNLINSLFTQTRVYVQKGHMDSALIKINKAITILETSNNYQKSLAKSYFNAGNVYDEMNEYHEAARYFLLALQYFEKSGNKKAQAIVKSSLGRIYINLDENEKAIECIEKAKLLVNNKSNNYAVMSSNLAIAYKNIENYKKALKYYNESLVIKIKLQDSMSIANTYNGIGVVYSNMGDNEKALVNFYKALEIKEKLGNPKYIASTLNNIASIRMAQADYPGTIELSKRAYRLANSVNAKHEIFFALENLSNAYEHLGEFEDALFYYKVYDKAKDSITLQKEGGKNLILKYEIKAKEDELKLQIAQSKNKTYLILLLGLIICIISISIYFYQKNQKDKHQSKITEERAKEAEAQKRRFAKELHDDTGSNLTGIRLQLLALKNTIGDNTKITEIINEVERAQQGVRLISYQASPPEFNNCTLDEALKDLTRRLTKSDSLQIQYSSFVSLDWTHFKQEQQLNIYRIIQEALSNVFKHAKAQNVSIQIIQHETNLNIMVEDDGKGFNIETVNKGLGLANITDRVNALDGSLHIESASENGCTIIIDLPIPKNS